MSSMDFLFSFLLLGQLATNSIEPETPIQSLKASFDTELEKWGFESLPPESKLSDFNKEGAKPLVLFLNESILLPVRKDKLRYSFSHGAEIQPPTPIREWSEVEWKKFTELHFGVCEFILSDVQEIFVPPYVISARALPIEKVEVSDKPTHRELKLIPAENIYLKSLHCYLALGSEMERVLEALPAFAKIVMQMDPSKELPVEKETKTERDFILKELSEPGIYSGYFDSRDRSEFQKFMDEPHWRVQKGFDSWGGYYERAETQLGEKTSLSVEIRRYGPFWGRDYNDLYGRPLWPSRCK